jgi:hypothetical protein
MNGFLSRRAALATAGALVGVLAPAAEMASPAEAASSTIHYSYTDPTTTQELPCGAVWTFGGEHKGTIIKPDDEGGYFKVVQQDYYPGTITFGGRTYTANDHQTDISYVRDDVLTGTLNGQGLFTHLPGIGVVVSDTGHLVFVEGTGQTIQQSDNVIPLDQPFDYGAAVCAALTGQAAVH